jgi:endonuclease YncB( thermonuclease family)
MSGVNMLFLAAALITRTITQVPDGDTFRIGDTRIRLAAIDANEMNGSCHNQCAPMSAEASRDHLARLALGHRVECDQTGTSYNRVVAFCRIGALDLSCAQVRAGAAIIWDKYDPRGVFRRRCLGGR